MHYLCAIRAREPKMLSADFSASASDSERQDQGYNGHLDEDGAHSLIQYLAFCQENNYDPHKKKTVIKISSASIHWLKNLTGLLIIWSSFLFSCLNACVVHSVKVTFNFFYRVTPLKIFNENRGQRYVLPCKICQKLECFIRDIDGFHSSPALYLSVRALFIDMHMIY